MNILAFSGAQFVATFHHLKYRLIASVLSASLWNLCGFALFVDMWDADDTSAVTLTSTFISTRHIVTIF
jgi:hypothetical protein